ncbi:unnamed protein product [Leptidea sinapis]|uniref:Uncharacterized protein n=1 Tax=Leptidea sinapis TaxID=189913 RepID=A0A5E4QS22_9NEOP|nr:unnamed protein product [Leptidea sinapis]
MCWSPSKKRKQDKDKVNDESGTESEKSHKKEKKKKKDKKKKRHHSGSISEREGTPEANHPLVMTSKIDPREIPERRPRYRERERPSYTRSGRVIKGRGVFRFRTRSRSRSVTPPHWRQAQRRIVKELSTMSRRSNRGGFWKRDGRTPPPREREEGEIDTNDSREKLDYNALDFEEDMDQDAEEGEIVQKKSEVGRRDLRHRMENRADLLARALGVNPRHERNI